MTAPALKVNDAAPRRPQGARSEAREEAILSAARELLLEVGYENLSIDAVADRAHAGKATIYRHFPDKASLVLHAITCEPLRCAEVPDEGSLRADLLEHARQATETACLDADLFAGLVNASRNDAVFATLLRERMLEAKIGPITEIVERAVGRGELPDASRVRLVCEVASAVVLHRLFVSRAPFDEAFRRYLVDEIAIPLLSYRPEPKPARAETGDHQRRNRRERTRIPQ